MVEVSAGILRIAWTCLCVWKLKKMVAFKCNQTNVGLTYLFRLALTPFKPKNILTLR